MSAHDNIGIDEDRNQDIKKYDFQYKAELVIKTLTEIQELLPLIDLKIKRGEHRDSKYAELIKRFLRLDTKLQMQQEELSMSLNDALSEEMNKIKL